MIPSSQPISALLFEICNREKQQVDTYSVKLDELRKRLCEIERTRIDVFKTYKNGRIEDVVRSIILNLLLRFISFNN